MLAVDCTECDNDVVFHAPEGSTSPLYETCKCGQEWKLRITRVKRASDTISVGDGDAE